MPKVKLPTPELQPGQKVRVRDYRGEEMEVVAVTPQTAKCRWIDSVGEERVQNFNHCQLSQIKIRKENNGE